MARYLFAHEIGTAVNLRVQSGFAYSPIYSTSLPRAGTVRVFSANIDKNRTRTRCRFSTCAATRRSAWASTGDTDGRHVQRC